MRKLFIFALMLLAGVLDSGAQDRRVTSTSQAFLTSGGTYKFEIWARRTGANNVLVGTSSLYFDYNALGMTSPTLSNVNSKYTGVDGLLNDYAPMTAQIVTVGSVSKIAVTITFTGNDLGISQPMSTTDELICTVSLTVLDPSASSGLSWDSDNSAFTDSRGAPPPINTFVGSDNSPLPIQLASFTASVVRDNDVEVTWKTVSETNNYGFEIYRKRGETGEWKQIAFVEGHATTLTPQSYSHVDHAVTFGKYFYQIKQIDLDGKSKAFPEVDVTVGIAPGKFTLAQNYPNPFNPSTLIEFAVPQSGRAILKVYNLLGQEVATLFEGDAETGKIYTALFDASDVASGVYFYRLRAGESVGTKRLSVLK